MSSLRKAARRGSNKGMGVPHSFNSRMASEAHRAADIRLGRAACPRLSASPWLWMCCSIQIAVISTIAAPAVLQSRQSASPNALSTQDALPPPRSGLVSVHWPKLDSVEADVREQLSSVQQVLTASAGDPALTDSRLSEAYGLAGHFYHAYSLSSPAEECYLNARRLAPSEFKWPHLLGNLYDKLGRTDEAVEHYKLVRRLRPDYVAAAVSLGNLYLQQGRQDESRASFEEAIKIDPSSAAAQYGLGQLALSRRDYSAAAGYLERALALAPEANRIHYSLAMAYRGLGNTEKARLHLQRQGPVGVRAADPLVDGLKELVRGERLHLVRGRVAFEAGRFSEAAFEFRKAVSANPRSAGGRLNLGSALAQMGDTEAAIEQYNEVLRLDPANAGAHFNVGLLLAKENKYEDAISHLKTAVDLNPKDTEARLLLARQLLKAERADEALAQLSRVVDSDPNNEDALLEQTGLLIKKSEFVEALKALEKGHAQFPTKGRTAALLAWLLASSPRLELRDGARALDLAKRVYESTGLVNDGAIVAMALAELGRCEEAAMLQRRLIADAERSRQSDLAEKLKVDLKRYETARPCRPPVSH